MLAFVDFLYCSVGFLLLARVLTQPAADKVSARARIALAAVLTYLATLPALWVSPTSWTLLAIAAAAAVGTTAMLGDGLRSLGEAFGKRRFAVYLLSVATLSALIHLFVPITTFLTSPGELGIHLDYLLKTNVRDAMVLVYAAALLYAMAFTSRMRTTLAFLALVAVTLGLVYSYALPFGYPMMTGLQFEQLPTSGLSRSLRLLADLAVVAALVLALVALVRRFGGRPFVAGLVLVNVSLSIAAGIGIRRETVGGAGGPEDDAELVAQPLRYSKTEPNVLIVFLDRFMGGFVESILVDEPQLADELSGFTWYPRTIAAGQNSIAGIHPLLGGYDYLPVEMNARGQKLRDVSVEAFSILPYNFSRHGYQVNLVSPRGLGFTMMGDCSYLQMPGVACTHIPQTVARRKAEAMGFPMGDLAKSNYADLLVLLGGMRSAPYAVKDVLQRRGPWQATMDHSAGTTFREWAELGAWKELSFVDAEEPSFNFVSNILPHEPYYLNDDCRPARQQVHVGGKRLRLRGHPNAFSYQHEVAARCSLLLVGDYLRFLKEAGVYDNTTIVIVSDHGIVGPVPDRSTRATAGGTAGLANTRSVLLVKKRGAQGRLQVSETFLPNAEVPRIVCEDIGGCVNPYLENRPIATDGRDDPFYISIVPWQFSQQDDEAFVIEEQFELRGKDPYDIRGWRKIDPDAVVLRPPPSP